MGERRAAAGAGQGGEALIRVIDLSDERPGGPSVWLAVLAGTVLVALHTFGVWTNAEVPLLIAVFQGVENYGTLALFAIPVWRLSERWTASRLRLPALLLA